MQHLLDIIAGARPNFMKIASIIKAIKESQVKGSHLEYRLIHTGQHYDAKMSGEFFSQLNIPEPDINLRIGSGSQAEQTAGIMIGYERVLEEHPSRMCLVVGDVTSTMACSIVAKKMQIPVAHVEAGIRSGDWRMPEEINRVVTDSITNYFFTTSEYANKNLIQSGVSEDAIYFVGNTMIDTLVANQGRFLKPVCWDSIGLCKEAYFVLTLHRPSNVDHQTDLIELLQMISNYAEGVPVLFPVHPRTKKNLGNIEVFPENLYLLDPMGYLEFNYLVQHSKGVLTDSGGITEETTFMNIPCITLRENTERPETVWIGSNELVGTDPIKIKSAMRKIHDGVWKQSRIPEKWDGKAGQRIVSILEKLLSGVQY